MLRFVVVAGIAGSAAGCVAATEIAVPLQLAVSDEGAIKEGVRRKLRDPSSAQFEDLVAGRAPSGTMYACGVVNARNAFGGYAGRAPFYGVFAGGEFRIAALGNADGGYAEHAAIRSLCKAHGVPLPDRA